MPEQLSPAAQAIDGALAACIQLQGEIIRARPLAAAALEALADQVITDAAPPCADFDEYAQGFLAAHVKYRSEILAIAAELRHPS